MSMNDFTPPDPFEMETETVPVSPGVPHSRKAEEAVCGSILIDPQVYWQVTQEVNAESFYIHRNRWIFEVFAELAEAGVEIDLLTVTDALEKRSKLSEVGGSAYVTSLINQVPSSTNAVSYARIVSDMAERRKGIRFANELASAAYKGEPFDLRQQAIKIIQTDGARNSRVTAKQAGSQAIDRVMTHPRFCYFGVPNIDKKVGGLFEDELAIIAGYPGTGKTAWQIQSARINAEKGKKVLDVSLEMTAVQKWLRMACGDLEIDMNQLRSGRVTLEEKSQVVRRMDKLSTEYEGKIVIYEAPMSPMDILSAVMVERPDVIYIDHLDLIDGKDKRMSLVEWYKYCCRFLRQNVAKGYNHIPCVLLHQLSRDAAKQKREPGKHDLAYAGDAEADTVFIAHRNEDDIPNREGIVDVKFKAVKSRFGWTGDLFARFKLPEQRFYAPIGEIVEYDWQSRADIGDD